MVRNKGRVPWFPYPAAWPAAKDWGLVDRGSFGCEPRTNIQLFSVSSPRELSSMSLLHAGHIIGPCGDRPLSLHISDSNQEQEEGEPWEGVVVKAGHQPTTHGSYVLGLPSHPAPGSQGHWCGCRWTRGSTPPPPVAALIRGLLGA